MTKNTNTKKKSSASKKLIPAIGMLTVSAMMLSTATYAWFTMSREVEVTGLNMTATVPEDLQISLGRLAMPNAPATAATEGDGIALVNSTGTLYAENGANASNLGAVKPVNTWDWSNSADISAYYAFGRLIPASSTTGEKIFYTPDASGVGKTIKANASFYQANDALFARPTNSTATASADDVTANSARATLHAYTAKEGANPASADTWASAKNKTFGNDYTQAADWMTTNDDGYYIDVPVWIRTSSNENVALSVDGYVIPGKSWDNGESNTKTETELELYRAVRVALIDAETDSIDSTNAGAPAVADRNIIPLKDAWKKKDGHTATTTYTAAEIEAVANPWAKALDSIVDSANLATTGRAIPSAATGINTDYAVGATGQLFAGVTGADTNKTDPDNDGVVDTYVGTYGNYTCLTPSSDAAAATGGSAAVVPSTVATIPGSGTANQYGAEKKLIIRVWLDGEDGECWNGNAGQDWAISLKFSKIS